MIDPRKGFLFQDCILKCNDYQSLPAKCFRVVIKSLNCVCPIIKNYMELIFKESELEPFSNSQSPSWYLQACSLALTSKQAYKDHGSGFATASQASQSRDRLPWKRFMSVEFILWDRFQIGTQEASKVLKEFHHLWLEMDMVQNSGNSYSRKWTMGDTQLQ